MSNAISLLRYHAGNPATILRKIIVSHFSDPVTLLQLGSDQRLYSVVHALWGPAFSLKNLGLVLSGRRISELCGLAPQGQSLLSAIVGSDGFEHAPHEHEVGHFLKYAEAVDASRRLHRRRRLHSECAISARLHAGTWRVWMRPTPLC